MANRFQRTIRDAAGNVAAAVAVTVTDPVSGSPVSIFTDEALTSAKANPGVTDANGRFDFWAAETVKLVDVTAGEGVSAYTLKNVLIGVPQSQPYPNRAAAEAANIPATITRILVATPSGDTLAYVRDASGTALTTADGGNWSPDGVAYPDHWAENTTPGTTDMNSAFASYLGNLGDFEYRVTSTKSHPNVRHRVEPFLRTTTAISPAYVVQSLDDIRIGGRYDLAGGGSLGLIIRQSVNGYFLEQADVEAEGFAIAIKPSLSTAYSITSVTNENPAVFTRAAHGFINGQTVKLAYMLGGTWETVSGVFYTVANATTDTFTLGIDGTALGTFTSGIVVSAPGKAENGMAALNNVRGGADTADVGISWDGDTENFAAVCNIITDIQRTDSERPAHAFAVAGGDGDDIAYSRNANGLIFGNIVDDIGGNAFHLEDACPRISFSFNVARNVLKFIEIVNDDTPLLQNYIGGMCAGATEYFIDAVGLGGSKNTNYAFNIFDGDGVSLTTTAAVRLNQPNTKNINYIGQIHYDLTQNAVTSDANGPVNYGYNIFETITGDCITNTRSTASLFIHHNIFDGGVNGIAGSSETIDHPSEQRGIWVESNNSFAGVTNPVKKANSSNIIGDQRVVSPVLASNVASNTILFAAQRDGWITGITRIHTSAGGAGTANSTFSVYKTNSGGSTLLLSNSVTRFGAQYDLFLWTGTSAQMLVTQFDAGDIIRVECNGIEDAETLFQIQLDWFHY